MDEVTVCPLCGERVKGRCPYCGVLLGAPTRAHVFQDQGCGRVVRSGVVDGVALAYVRGVELSGAYMSGMDLFHADLCAADLRGADLGGANLNNADLRSADLRGANLAGADLSDADLRGADLRWANMIAADLRGARYNWFTRWPSDVDPHAAGAVVEERE
ncbi:MAG: pentapeptide repeat-containing protein [Anaerolineae bacterium]|nr:pentapeptide repeat-containing protein [Anaerolineae bacterium]